MGKIKDICEDVALGAYVIFLCSALGVFIFLALTGCASNPQPAAPITPPVYSDVRVYIIDPENPALVFKRPAPTLDGRICEVCREPMWEESGHYELRHNLKPFVK